jgi:hypothetical protein
MKKSLLLAGLILIGIPGISVAQTTTATGTGTANSNSQSGAIAISGGGQGGGGGRAQATGGSAKIIFNTPGSTTSRVITSGDTTSRIRQSGSLRTVPGVVAPGLGAAGVETCYGPGVSGGIAVTGFGASFGAGQFDQDCNARLFSRTLYAMGYKQQAIQLLVNQSPMVASAFGLGQQGGQPSGSPVTYGRPNAAIRPMASNGGCKKWSGGAVGVGSCLY